MQALCLMLLVTYYAFNYAGIIGQGLTGGQFWQITACQNQSPGGLKLARGTNFGSKSGPGDQVFLPKLVWLDKFWRGPILA